MDIGDTFIIEQKSETWAKRVKKIAEKNVSFAEKEFSLNIKPNDKARTLIWIATIIIAAYGGFLAYTYVLAEWTLYFFYGLLAANLLFFVPKIKNYSRSGGRIVSQLEGLKMYILAAEHQSLSEEPEPNSRTIFKNLSLRFCNGTEYSLGR